jgi:hypothetical protein
MKESDVIVLTKEEHKNFYHICGRTGREVDAINPCKTCPKDVWVKCAMSHVEKGVDAEGVLGMIRTGATEDDVKQLYEYAYREFYRSG